MNTGNLTAALLLVEGGEPPETLIEEMSGEGLTQAGPVCDCSNLVHAVESHAPDVVIAHVPALSQVFVDACRSAMEIRPLPILVFTQDRDLSWVEAVLSVGVQAYVVDGYAPGRLPSLVAVAQARFDREQALLSQLQDVSQRFEERKLVERAKGILMRARAMSDDDAFDVLRTTSMHTNQRLADVSRFIIASAERAEAVNRAGQLRMLSQRLVKLHLLRQADVHASKHAGLLKESLEKADANLKWLGKALRDGPESDVLALLKATWKALQAVLSSKRQTASSFQRLDDLAQRLLEDAENLTSDLQQASAVPSLQVLNVAGRQRMLSQRFAKLGLMNVLLADESGASGRDQELDRVRGEFERAMAYLGGLPLSTPDIQRALSEASGHWVHLLSAVARPARTGQERLQRTEIISTTSEALLSGFEFLSQEYERSMQMLVG